MLEKSPPSESVGCIWYFYRLVAVAVGAGAAYLFATRVPQEQQHGWNERLGVFFVAYLATMAIFIVVPIVVSIATRPFQGSVPTDAHGHYDEKGTPHQRTGSSAALHRSASSSRIRFAGSAPSAAPGAANPIAAVSGASAHAVSMAVSPSSVLATLPPKPSKPARSAAGEQAACAAQAKVAEQQQQVALAHAKNAERLAAKARMKQRAAAEGAAIARASLPLAEQHRQGRMEARRAERERAKQAGVLPGVTSGGMNLSGAATNVNAGACVDSAAGTAAGAACDDESLEQGRSPHDPVIERARKATVRRLRERQHKIERRAEEDTAMLDARAHLIGHRGIRAPSNSPTLPPTYWESRYSPTTAPGGHVPVKTAKTAKSNASGSRSPPEPSLTEWLGLSRETRGIISPKWAPLPCYGSSEYRAAAPDPELAQLPSANSA